MGLHHCGALQCLSQINRGDKEAYNRFAGNGFSVDVMTYAWKRHFVFGSVDTRYETSAVRLEIKDTPAHWSLIQKMLPICNERSNDDNTTS